MSYHIPGYAGYQRNYATEYVAIKNDEVPPVKFTDVDVPRRSLMQESGFRTIYNDANEAVTSPSLSSSRFLPSRSVNVGASHEEKTRISPRTTTSTSSHLPTSSAAIISSSTASWKSVYGSTFNAHDSFGVHSDRLKRETTPNTGLGGDSSLRYTGPGQFNSTHTAFLRPAEPLRSTYGKDLGVDGSNPRQFVDPSHSRGNISGMATSRDLFAGTSKASQVPPGYAGWVPSSERNLATFKTASEPLPATTLEIYGPLHNRKDNLVQNHHNAMPGYTGHRPQAASNDAIIRAQRSPPPPTGHKPSALKASLNLGGNR